MKFYTSLFFLFSCLGLNSQVSTDSLYKQLSIDTSFAYFQYADSAVGAKFLSLFDRADKNEAVILHYGGSHIQAGRPTRIARQLLQERYGDGGPGLMFNYTAADSYNSVNYTSSKTGTWAFGKSYILPAKVPLGVCGMAVETTDSKATLGFDMKETLDSAHYEVTLFTEIDSSSYGFEIVIDGNVFSYPKTEAIRSELKHAVKFDYRGTINLITIRLLGPGKYFRFYGLDIEKAEAKGVVYHSVGVGAAAMNSVLALEKAEQQTEILKPDIVILDFGTNDIMYHNAVNPKLIGQVQKAIAKFRAINPEMIIVLTSPQDLYYKGHYITAGPVFRNLMDSLAQANHCMFWNWYDCAGGLQTIRTWESLGYAKSDCIHLTDQGYEIKGRFIAESIENTLREARKGKSEILLTGKTYIVNAPPLPEVKTPVKKPAASSKKYTVRSGDTLSQIAGKYHTSVSKIKSVNGLKSDMIRVGQVLKIP
jgi:lysophospholipase L1-like esterase